MGDVLWRLVERQWPAAVALGLVAGFVAAVEWWRRRHGYRVLENAEERADEPR